jgi:hypothetical protein
LIPRSDNAKLETHWPLVFKFLLAGCHAILVYIRSLCLFVDDPTLGQVSYRIVQNVLIECQSNLIFDSNRM